MTEIKETTARRELSEIERIKNALEEHNKKHPNQETQIVLGRELYPADKDVRTNETEESKQRGIHTIREEERLKRENEELAKVRAIIQAAQKEPAPFQATGIFSEVKASKEMSVTATPPRRTLIDQARDGFHSLTRSMAEIVEEKEKKRNSEN